MHDADRWKEATDAEFSSVDAHEVYTWVDASDVPSNEDIVSSRLVFTKKLGKMKEVKKYKVRWVARDMYHKLDFNETSSPTAHPVSVSHRTCTQRS